MESIHIVYIVIAIVVGIIAILGRVRFGLSIGEHQKGRTSAHGQIVTPGGTRAAASFEKDPAPESEGGPAAQGH